MEVHIKIFFSLLHCEGLEKMIAPEQDSWNNCTVAHIWLKLHKLTSWFLILCMNVVQLLKHFWNYCFSSFYAFYHFHLERVGYWFYALNTTLNKFILQIGYPSNHLVSLRKSALIQKPSWLLPKDLNQHGIADKTKKY